MALSQHLTNADAFPQFIVSKIDKDAKGVVTKVPYNPAGTKPSNHLNPANWMTLAEAEIRVSSLNAKNKTSDYRVGFSLTAGSGVFFLDIDKAVIKLNENDPNEIGQWSTLAAKFYSMFTGCFIEVSQSGKGLHIIGRYTDDTVHRNKNDLLHIELYTTGRFVMFGGINTQGDWNTDATVPLISTIFEYFNKDVVEDKIPTTEQQKYIGNLTDEQVLMKARAYESAATVFGNTPSFSELFDGDVEALARAYPSPTQGKLYNYSLADLALANMLAKHTEGNEKQVERLMWKSKLVRDKWTERKTYLPDTIAKAISGRLAGISQHTKSIESRSGCQEILADIPQEFEGCYYVKTEREIYSIQHGLLNQDAFNMCYGGLHLKDAPYKSFRKYAAISGRVIECLGFKPHLKHGEITEHEGIRSINTYKPIAIKKREGDITPFFRFFNAMIPNKRDQEILLSYAAVLAQKPGVKSQWAIVLQGVQGCGKSLFADFIAYACGETYTHSSKGDEFEGRFNIQWFAKTLILIEDPQVRSTKLEEALKPLVTSKRLAFEGKGSNIQMNDFPANFIITVNDFDRIQKRKETRRIAVFMSALQTPEDLINAGMTPAEFRKIADWQRTEGNEIFAHFIHNYIPNPNFDFAGNCVTAPDTSTTQEVIEASRSQIEMILLEEIEQGRKGFKGGWLSSTALTDFLNAQHLRHLMPDNKRGPILKALGYVYHPHLPQGLASRNVSFDNRRPRIFIKIGHPSTEILDRELIMKTFEDAQK